MKVITIESSAYKAMMEQIAEIAGYIRELKEERQRQETETKDRLLDTAQTAELLNVSVRTLQRMRDEHRIEYIIVRGKCRYRLSEIQRLLNDNTVRNKEETIDASFKVNTELEKWYDFGIGKGGNILALAAELYHSEDVAYLLKRIEERTAYIRPASFSFGRQHSDNQPYQGLRVGELSSPALIAYLQERGINIGLAKRECRELRFMNADKPYFAIGFPNMAGGYEVRNRYFKGCVAPKDITHIRQQGGQRCMCYLFEGFMDYLSFLTIRVENNPQHPRLDTQDYIILNSVSNLAKAESILETYTQVGCFLDNDTAGRNTCKKLKEKFGERLLDKSMYYREYKDLNDYLCGKPLSQSAEPIKEKKQVQSARRMMQPPKKKGGFHL